ncbi:OprO/OprP family phosphate-selective porin [Paraurantiacibacter namhicola]|uniref:Porin P n=1 Tax=Paraurantiacibacter namhicola TaxID=645517 RepID=A0A1C7D9A1_9SPHN|nr:porin [Paraurantiacibacter namhicola]ANU07883.1 Porin P precursor [Paraurantiacibacter namhicola]
MRNVTLIGLALAATSLTSLPAAAQQAGTMSVQEELAQMRAEMAALSGRVATLEGELEQTKAELEQERARNAQLTQPAAPVAVAVAPAAEPGAEIEFKGAPEISADGGWSFKPRGRIQADAGFISAPDSTGAADGFGSNLRRARIGMQGDIPGGFGYKFEVDFAGDQVTLADAILTYEGKGVDISIGQHNNFQSLEELTSSLHTSFIERAAFTDAFGFERRLGISVEFGVGDVSVQAGAFSDNISDLPGKEHSFDGRVVYAPKFGDGQLHLGASVHYADTDSNNVRYRQRPLVNFTSERFVNTGNLAAESEFGYGAEAAFISGRFHVAGEAFWQNVDRPGALADPTFFGGYAEAGVFLTSGDSRGYKGGTFNRIKPASPVGEGGIGAIQFNVRYDHLDLNDAGITGGKQNGYFASLVWTPTDYTRFLVNYGRLEYTDAVLPETSGNRDYSVDVVGVRAQVDF